MVYSFIFSLTCYLLIVRSILAVTTSISNIPHSISTDPFTITVTVSGAGTGKNYLRIDLFKSPSTNYFGETHNTLGWYSDSDYSLYYSINIESGVVWSGDVQGRIGNPTSAQYNGPGMYKLRVRRYTSSGNYNSTEANDSAADIEINASLTTPPVIQETSTTPAAENDIHPVATPTVSQTYANVFISEVMIDPESDRKEWVEIYNANGFELVLTDWLIDDIEDSGSTPKKFSLAISPHSYSTIDLTGSIFNNTGDSVRLTDSTGKEIDSFQYSSSEKNKTLGRISFENDNFCLQNPSRDKPNNSCLNPTSEKKTSATSYLSTPTPIIAIQTPPALIQTSYQRSPVSFSYFNQTPISIVPEENAGEILGADSSDKVQNSTEKKALTSALTFTSFSYSILALISILFKLKNN